MMKQSAAIMIFFGALGIQGCAHTPASKNLDQKITEESQIKSGTESRADSRAAIDSAPGLTSEQRSQLKTLGKSTREKLNDLRNQSYRLRAVLVDDMVATNYNPQEVATIKKRIEEVEKKRLALTFDSIDKANGILGRHPNPNVLHDFSEDFDSRAE